MKLISVTKKLVTGGISKERIFRIPPLGKQQLSVEDLVDKEIYLAAVNEELHRSHGTDVSFPSSRLPAEGRPRAVKTWCKHRNIDQPSKRAFAYHILELGIGRSILAQRYQGPLQKLYSGITAAFQDKSS